MKDKVWAARRLGPDQKNYLRDDIVSAPVISVWDYAMIGCFFGKKVKKLQSINHRELIEFQDSYTIPAGLSHTLRLSVLQSIAAPF